MEAKTDAFLIDTHAHLASSRFHGELEAIVSRANEAGVKKIISIACDLEDSHENLAMSDRYESVAPTAGIHPLYVHEVEDQWESELAELVQNPKLAALGEIGLDYFHAPPEGYTDSTWRARQLEVFEKQLQLAIDAGLPVVIHQRDSAEDVAAVLSQFPTVRAVLHCFTGTIAQAEAALEMGHLLSFTGIVTFPNAPEIRAVAAVVPQDRIMVETDCPYLAPVPFRGKRCEPSMVVHTADTLAGINGLKPEELARLTTRNAESFFRL